MNKTKIVQLIRTFSNREVKSFTKYLQSPFFNEHEILVDLFDHICKYMTPEDHEKLQKPAVFEAIYPGKEYDDLKLRHLMADLMRHAEQFLVLRNKEDGDVAWRIPLLLELRQREQHKHYESIFRSTQQQLLKDKARNAQHYYTGYALEAEYSSYLGSRQQRLLETNLQQTIDNLDVFYILEKLRYGCIFLNYRNVLAVDYRSLLLGEILKHVEEKGYADIPAIAIYYHILKTLEESGGETHYLALKELLLAHIDLFPRSEAKELYAFANNYCIKQINKGEPAYLKEIFANYQVQLQKEILLEENELSPWDYKNIVVTGLRLHEKAWVREFIEAYKPKLSADFRENAYNYNLAYFHFYNKQYDEVLQLLQQVEFDDVFYSLDSKSMLLKTYYELDERESLYSLTDSFRIFLKRNKLISDNHRTNYLNLIKFVKKLCRIQPWDKDKLTKLEEEVNKVKRVADMRWLREKIADLG